MTKAEQKKFEAMESALKVIHTWASYYHEVFNAVPYATHRKNLKDIVITCLLALGRKKK